MCASCVKKAQAAAAANAAAKASQNTSSPIATVKTRAFRGPGRPPASGPRVITSGIRRK